MTLVRLASSSTDQTVLQFNDGEPMQLQSTVTAQYGFYNLTFLVGLDECYSFEPTPHELQFEVVPDCALSVISAEVGFVVSFKNAPRLSIQELDLKPKFTHSMSLEYNGYCNPLEYVVTPALFADSTFTSDTGIITILPAAGLTLGLYPLSAPLIFTLEVSLKDFAAVPVLKTFRVNVIDCRASAFYATGPTRVNQVKEVVYVIGTDSQGTVSLEFDDFDLTSGAPGCAGAFVHSYDFTIDGSSDIPAWFKPGGYDQRYFQIETIDVSFSGQHTVVVSSTINTIPGLQSSTTLSILIYIKTDDCYAVEIIEEPLDDIYFLINYGAVPIVNKYALFATTAPVGLDCGQLAFNLVGSLAGSVVTLDPDERKISVFTTSGLDVSVGTYTLEIWMAKYPMLKSMKGKFVDFEVEIDSVCLQTVINEFPMPETVHQQLMPAVIVNDILYSDTESLVNGKGDGFTLCGPRKFTPSDTTIFTVPSTGNIISMTVEFPRQPVKTISTKGKPTYTTFKVSLEVALVEYPQVTPQTFSFTLYSAGDCDESFLNVQIDAKQKWGILTLVGNPKLYENIPECQSTVNVFLQLGGVKEDRNLHYCGICEVELNFKQFKPAASNLSPSKQTFPSWLTYGYNTTLGVMNKLILEPLEAANEGVWTLDATFGLFYFPDLLNPSKYELEITVKAASKSTLGSHAPKYILISPCAYLECQINTYCEIKIQITDEDPDEEFKTAVNGNSALFQICPSCTGYIWDTKTQIFTIWASPNDGVLGLPFEGSVSVVDSQIHKLEIPFGFTFIDAAQDPVSLCAAVETSEVVVQLTNVTMEAQDNSTNITNTNSTAEDVKVFNEFLLKFAWLIELGNFDDPIFVAELALLPFPFPYIWKVTQTGLVTIRFSKEILVPTTTDMIPFLYYLHENELISLSLCTRDPQFSDCLSGIPIFDEQLFRLTNANFTYPEYLNETRSLRGSSQVQKVIALDASGGVKDSAVEEVDKNFNWTVVAFADRQIIIQIGFNKPFFVSAPIWDNVQVKLDDIQDIFMSPVTGKSIPNGYVLKKLAPKQLSAEVAAAIAGSSNFGRYAMQLLQVGNILLSMSLNTCLQTLWSGINALQFTIHLPIYSIYFPANVIMCFEQLIKIVTFDILDTLQDLGFKDPIVVSASMPFNDNFNELRYDNSNTYQNLGSMNYFLWFMAGKTIYFGITRLPFFRGSRIGLKIRGKATWSGTFNIWTRFFLEAFFDMLMAVMITLVQGEYPGLLQWDRSEWLTGDYFTFIYTLFILGCCILFTIFVVVAVNTCLRKIIVKNRQDSDKEQIEEEEKVLVEDEEKMLVQEELSVEQARDSSRQNFIKFKRPVTTKDSHLSTQNNEVSNVDLYLFSEFLKVKPEEKRVQIFPKSFYVTDQHEQDFKKVYQLQEEPEKEDGSVKESFGMLSKEQAKSQEGQKDEEDEEVSWLETFTEGMDLTSFQAMWYHVVFLVRRILFIFAGFWLIKYPAAQAHLFLNVTLFNGMYLFTNSVFEETFSHRLELMNEMFVYFSGLFVLVLLISKDEPEFCMDVGWGMLSSIGLNLVINMALAGKTMFTGFRVTFAAYKIKMRQKAADFDQSSCICKCAHCGKKANFEETLVLDKPLEFRIELINCNDDSQLLLVPSSKKKMFKFTEETLERLDLEETKRLTENVFAEPKSSQLRAVEGWKKLRVRHEYLDEHQRSIKQRRYQETMRPQQKEAPQLLAL